MEFIEDIFHEYPGTDEIRLKCGAVIKIDKDGDEVRVGVYNNQLDASEGKSAVLHVISDGEEAKIKKVADAAARLFWQKILDEFPEYPNGDLHPRDFDAIDKAMLEAVKKWVAFGKDQENA